MRVLILCVLLVWASAVTSPFIDMWELIKDAKCLTDTYKTIALRIYQTVGKIEPNFAKNIELLKEYRAKVYVGAYINPCFSCDAVKQAVEIATALKEVKIDMASIDVEGTWNNERAKNVAFLKTLTAELTKLGIKYAIITGERNWERIMGRDCNEFSTYPLWYINHDNDPELRRFRPFGGWTTATVMAKQYAAGEVCGNSVNKDSEYKK